MQLKRIGSVVAVVNAGAVTPPEYLLEFELKFDAVIFSIIPKNGHAAFLDLVNWITNGFPLKKVPSTTGGLIFGCDYGAYKMPAGKYSITVNNAAASGGAIVHYMY